MDDNNAILDTFIAKSKFSKIMDSLLVTIATYFLCRIFTIYVIHSSTTVSKLGCLIISFSATLIFVKYINKHYERMKIKQEDRKLFERTALSLSLMTQSELVYFFKKALPKRLEPTIKNGNLILKNEILVLYDFADTTLDKNAFLHLINAKNNKKYLKILIFCNNFDKFTLHFVENIKSISYSLLNAKNIFDLLKETNQFPPPLTDDTMFRRHKPTLNTLFNKSKIKKYILAGIGIYLITFLTRTNHIYYTLLASTCFILAIICIFFNNK